MIEPENAQLLNLATVERLPLKAPPLPSLEVARF
jgi:hypothetical protein